MKNTTNVPHHSGRTATTNTINQSTKKHKNPCKTASKNQRKSNNDPRDNDSSASSFFIPMSTTIAANKKTAPTMNLSHSSVATEWQKIITA